MVFHVGDTLAIGDFWNDPDAGDNAILTCTSTQADGTALPGWMVFETNSAIATARNYEPSVGDPTIPATAENVTYSIKAECADSETTVSGTFQVTINDIPAANTTIPDQLALVGDLFTYTIPDDAFSDFDTYALSVTGLPASITFSPATGKFSGTPVVGDVGTAALTITATDTHGRTAT